jgi:hypothetical protein
MVPQLGEHEVEFCVRAQLTPLLLGSLLTVAMNGVAFDCRVAFTGMSALVGETETVTAGTVICAKFDT